MELVNREDTCTWVRMARNYSQQGVLKIDVELSITNREARESLFGFEGSSESKARVHVKIVGNLMAVTDAKKEEDKSIPPESIGLIILERVTVEIAHPTAFLPFPFCIVFSDGSACVFSAASDEERTSWMKVIGASSNEQTRAEANSLIDERRKEKPKRGTSKETPIPGPKVDTETVSTLLANPVVQRFSFDGGSAPVGATGENQKTICEEWMYESKLSITLPTQFLKQFVAKEMRLQKELEDAIPYVPSYLHALRTEHIGSLSLNVSRYQRALDFLETYSGPYFKQSIRKDREEFMFVPTNLHWQRFYVREERVWQPHDWLTSGAMAATPLGFEGGGVRKMHQQFLQDLAGPDEVDNSNERVFRERRQALEEVKQTIEGLRRGGTKKADWKTDTYKMHTGEQALASLKNTVKILKKWANNFPGINEAIDKLILYFSERNRRGEHTSPIGMSEVDSKILERQPELLGSQFEEIEDLLMSLETKVGGLNRVDFSTHDETNQLWLESIRSAIQRLTDVVERIRLNLNDAQILQFLLALPNKGLNSPMRQYYDLRFRVDVVLCQAAVAASTALVGKLWLVDEEEGGQTQMDEILSRIERWPLLPPMLAVISHLSCYREEKSMMEDMSEAWYQLKRRCSFRFVRSFASLRSSACVPLVESWGGGYLVSLPIPERVWAKLSSSLQRGTTFSVFPVFWNVGINHETVFAYTMADVSLEKELAEEAVAEVEAYLSLIQEAGMEELAIKVEQVKTALKKARKEMRDLKKNVTILRLASEISRTLEGEVLQCCKSGKDRTAMSVTLEEVQILRQTRGLREHQAKEILTAIRTDGVRRLNCGKNIGITQYAFSSFQMKFLPPDYRPPSGTYRQWNLLPS